MRKKLLTVTIDMIKLRECQNKYGKPHASITYFEGQYAGYEEIADDAQNPAPIIDTKVRRMKLG